MKTSALFAKISVLFLLIFGVSCAVSHPYRQKESTYYRLGSTKIRLIRYDFDSIPLVWFNMHDDENTAVRAARRAIRHGQLWELRHPGGRNIHFRLNGHRYGFDPNRIYTPGGRKKTLTEFSRTYTPEADSAVTRFAHYITNRILAGTKMVIALHNNTRGKYSVESYLPGAKYEADAAKVHVSSGMDPDDFYYCADSTVYQRLQAMELNALLQNDQNVHDDGSLSVYCGRHHIRYVNIEAQRGHRRTQELMIRQLQQVLDSTGLSL